MAYFNWLFNAKTILMEEQWWYYQIHIYKDKGIYTFLNGMRLKMNIKVQLGKKLDYF